MIYLMYSDLHIRPEKLVECELVLRKIRTVANKLQDSSKQPVTIINGGDTFNTRGLIRTSCFDVLYQHYHQWMTDGLRQVILVGNHDQEDRDGAIHPMRVFASFKDWIIVDKPTVFDQFVALPYMTMEQIKLFFEGYKGDEKRDAIIHWGVQGAMRNDSNKDSDGVPLEWLNVFRNVFSGHYHYRNALGNLQYIGSAYQQNYGEMGQDKGILIYNSETAKHVFHEIKGTPQHVNVSVKWDAAGQMMVDAPTAIFDKDHHRIRVEGHSAQCNSVTREFIKEEFGIENATVEREVREQHFSRLKIGSKEIYDTPALMEKYVDFVETDLDKDRLMQIGLEIVNGT